jgi:Zn-dependent protease
MAYDGESSFGRRLLNALSWSFPVGRWFGVDVRVYGLVVLVPLMGLYEMTRVGLPFDATTVGYALAGTVLLYFVVWTHEMGHVAMGRRWRIAVDRITLSPFGGAAHFQASAPSPRADRWVALAGPAVHLVWLAVLFPLRRFVLAEDGSAVSVFADYLWRLNLGLMVFNLLPSWPLDGGRVLRSVLATRVHPNLATMIAARIGYVGAAAFVVWGLFQGELESMLLVGLGISCALACRAAVLEAKWGESPYGEVREPWEADPDAWKRGDAYSDDPAGPPPAPRSRAEPARDVRSEAEVARDDAELDRLLDRVNEVGMAGLTASEREALVRLSRSRRKTGGRA